MKTVGNLPDWASQKAIDGVVWTALPPKFNKEQRKPSEEELLTYLTSLSGEARSLAEEYIRKAPRQVTTPYRHKIETSLGWWPA